MKAEYNRSLRIYLKDYLRNETAAFPILLEGPWGCGKTYFIGRLIEELKSGGRTVLYVSLNGVSCMEELERAILAAFTPNAAMGLGRLLLGAGRLQGCLGKGVGDVLKQIAKDGASAWARRHAVVFDDIERCQIPLKVWSGFLTAMLEELRVPTLFVGNELKLTEHDGYKGIKEKFIGQTFSLEADSGTVLPALCREMGLAEDSLGFGCKVSDAQLHEACDKVFAAVKEETKEANFRAFRGALWLLKHWLDRLAPFRDACRNPTTALRFLTLFLSLAYYAQLGLLTKESWGEEEDREAAKRGRRVGKSGFLTFEIVSDAWEGIAFDVFDDPFWGNLFVGPDYWKHIIFDQAIDPSHVNEALLQSAYFREKRAWEKLYWCRRLETGEIEQNLKELQRGIEKRDFACAAELLMAFSVKASVLRFRCEVSQPSGWPQAQEQLFGEFCRCVDDYCAAHSADLNTGIEDHDGYAGYQIARADIEDSFYRRMTLYLEDKYCRKRQISCSNQLASGGMDAMLRLFGAKELRTTVLLRADDAATLDRLTETIAGASNWAMEQLTHVLEDRYIVGNGNWKLFLKKTCRRRRRGCVSSESSESGSGVSGRPLHWIMPRLRCWMSS